MATIHVSCGVWYRQHHIYTDIIPTRRVTTLYTHQPKLTKPNKNNWHLWLEVLLGIRGYILEKDRRSRRNNTGNENKRELGSREDKTKKSTKRIVVAVAVRIRIRIRITIATTITVTTTTTTITMTTKLEVTIARKEKQEE